MEKCCLWKLVNLYGNSNIFYCNILFLTIKWATLCFMPKVFPTRCVIISRLKNHHKRWSTQWQYGNDCRLSLIISAISATILWTSQTWLRIEMPTMLFSPNKFKFDRVLIHIFICRQMNLNGKRKKERSLE